MWFLRLVSLQVSDRTLSRSTLSSPVDDSKGHTHLWSLPGRNWRTVIFGVHVWFVFNTSCRRIKPSSDSYTNVKACHFRKWRTTSTIAYETDRILRSDLKPVCCCMLSWNAVLWHMSAQAVCLQPHSRGVCFLSGATGGRKFAYN